MIIFHASTWKNVERKTIMKRTQNSIRILLYCTTIPLLYCRVCCLISISIPPCSLIFFYNILGVTIIFCSSSRQLALLPPQCDSRPPATEVNPREPKSHRSILRPLRNRERNNLFQLAVNGDCLCHLDDRIPHW